MTPDLVDARGLKSRLETTRPPGDPARLIGEALPDTVDRYTFSVAGEAIVRAIVAKKE